LFSWLCNFRWLVVRWEYHAESHVSNLWRRPELVDATGLEPTPGKSQLPDSKITCDNTKNAETQTGAHDLDKACQELAEIVTRWPSLSAELRAAILSFVSGAK
jgi:hypothetical protein